MLAQQRFPALFAEPGDARALFALDGTLVRTNEIAFALLGCDPDDPLGSAKAAIAPACREQAVRVAFARAMRGAIADAETQLVPRGGGSPIDFAVTLSPAVVEETICGVYASGRDTTRERSLARAAAREIAELSSLFQGHPDAMIAIDAAGVTQSVNAAFLALTDADPGDALGKPFESLIPSDAVAKTRTAFERSLGGKTARGDTALRHVDGSRIDVSATAVPIVVEGTIVGVYVIGCDIRGQRRTENDAHEQTERIRELYLVAASSGQTAEAQLHAALTLGCTRLGCDGAFLARFDGNVTTFVAAAGPVPYAEGAQIPLAALPSLAAIAALGPLDGASAETDGHTFLGTPLDLGGRRYGAVCFLANEPKNDAFSEADRDFVRLIGALAASAIERGEQRQKLDALAFFDELTGLPNRRLLEDRLAQAIAHAQREKTVFAVHFYDLDGFKAINDTYGHLRGDEVLRIIAHRIERVTRDVDTIARVGGDEFVVVQPDVNSRDDATILARRLREAIAKPLVLEGCEHRVTASGGIAFFGNDGRDAHALLAQADAALYRVKAAGRNDIAFASPPPPFVEPVG